MIAHSGNSEQLNIRIHARVLDSHPGMRFYYLCRALDSDGCGWVSLSVELAAQIFGVTPRTVQRWLEQGCKRGWFREVINGAENNKTIYYTSLAKVAAKLGLSGLGAIADVSIDQIIGRSETKALCTLLDALYKQKQSYFAARSAEKGQGKKRILKPWEVAASEKSPGARAMKVVSEPFKCPGASIAGIAKDSGWSVSTIKRRLSNQWRKDRDIECVSKRRIAIAIDDPGLLHEMGEANETFLIQGSKVLRIWSDSGRNTLLRMGCNVYDAAHELLSCRRLRWRCSKC